MKYLLPILAIVLTACTSYPQPPVYTINGEVPPGELAELVNNHVMIDTIQTDGNRLFVTRGTRLPGTRVGIHYHKYGGHTCVETGTITDFVEGLPSGVYPAGTCYYMPPATPMAAANLGDEPAILQDTFVLPPGEPTITIIEPGAPGYNTTILYGNKN